MPRINPLGETAAVDLLWENSTPDRYYLTVGDHRDGTMSRVIVIEPCQKSEARGVVVTAPDDIGFGQTDDDEAPDGPLSGGLDFYTLNRHSQWMFWIQPDDPNDDVLNEGNDTGYGPTDDFVPPAETEDLC